MSGGKTIKMHTLLVLMWKHLKVRIRRFISTFAELASTVGLLFLLFSLRNEINPVPPKGLFGNALQIQNTEPYLLEQSSPPQRLLYSPRQTFTDRVMDGVGEKLLLGRLDRITGERRRGFYGLTSTASLNESSNSTDSDGAIVIFHDMDHATPPERLEYDIRMRENYVTQLFMTLDELQESGPHERFGTIYEKFMRLQWAIDSTYLRILTNATMPEKLWVQEFPYPEQNLPGAAGAIFMCGIIEPISVLSLMLVFALLMSRLLEERSSGIQQLIKMVGVSQSTLSFSHFLNVLPAGLMYAVAGTALIKAQPNPMVANTHAAYICLLMILHFASVVAMAFACSYIVESSNYGMSLSFIAYSLLWFPTRMVRGWVTQRTAVLLLGLCPHMPVHWFWADLARTESKGAGANLWSGDRQTGSLLEAYLFLVLQTVFFSSLTWYLEQVRPGEHGSPKPWNFLFQRQYWSQPQVMPQRLESEEEALSPDQRYFEKQPKDMDVGVRIVNVSKEFGGWGRPKFRALSNVSLDIYRGEITVLLGHNGAGKTTLMSIITGMLPGTEGDVYVNGLHSVQQRGKLHKHLGLCPQHNLFFGELTVLEHVMFFSMLKGASLRDARDSSLKLLEQVGIAEKANRFCSELSGGMKRRLQLSCALAGNSDVLVLDEPTSGLDVETRRELWDLLLTLRGSRTVILTTHFMEEADALGDRIAALHGGRLKCHATPMFLKKVIGSGYRLTVTTTGAPDVSALTRTVTGVLPDAAERETSINAVSYSLPLEASPKYPQLFDTLEKRRASLGVESIGVGVTTLEEVFLELCRDVDTSMAEDELDSAATEPTYNKITGVALWLRQSAVLFKRQIRYTLSKRINFLLFQVVLPIFLISMIVRSTNNDVAQSVKGDRSRLDLDMYRDMFQPRVLHNIKSTPPVDWAVLQHKYPHVQFQHSDDIYNDVIKAGQQSAHEYNRYLLGIELNGADAKIHYTTTVRHAAPVALNLLSNVLSMVHQPSSAADTVSTINHPLAGTSLNLLAVREPKSVEQMMTWSLFVVFIVLATILGTITLPCQERVNGSRHIHVMSGCPAPLYWAVTWLYHMCVLSLTLLPAVLLSAAVLDKDATMQSASFLATVALILLAGVGAFNWLMFLLSFTTTERAGSVVLIFCVFIFGIVTPILAFAQEALVPASGGKNDTDPFFYVTVATGFARAFMPPHATAMALLRAGVTARLNAYCALNFAKCPDLPESEPKFDAAACCASSSHQPYSYATMTDDRPGPLILILLAQFLVLMALTVMCQYGVFNGLWDRLTNHWLKRYAPLEATPDDAMARREAEYVQTAVSHPHGKIEDAMLVQNLHKNYYKLFRGSFTAVKGVSFSVKKGECFGLLGVNGAGKSTTFKMLTGEEQPTRGRVYAAGHYLDTAKVQYMRALGYCPQFFGLDNFLTGRENLELMLTLRGLDAEDVEAQCKAWLHVVGLEAYAGRAVSGYSGGCVRRLGSACGLAAGAPVALLDEPTCGVDTAARRRVWRALRKGLQHDRSIVITSHSMDEMSALCNRIAIMHRGVVRALGTVSELRAAHTSGHVARLKLKDRDVIDAAGEVIKLKEYMITHFNCTLKDEHKTMLHYHINETLPYSELFARMESLKTQFPVVEDYSVTENTLEEVFLALAKEETAGDANNV